MYKKINNSDKIIISHIADIDGMGSVCLANAVFEDIDVILIEISELIQALEYVQDKNHSQIFITDIPFRNDSIEFTINKELLKNKIVHFDHHTSEVSNNKYSFINAIPVKNGINVCGTSLFYDYLKEFYPSPILEKDYTKEFIELIRSYDTWDWKKQNNTDARDLTTLFTVINYEEFINKFSKELMNNNNHFMFTDNDKFLIKNRDNEIKKYLLQCDKTMLKMNLLGYDVGVSISESFRSDVGNYLSEKYKDELSFILIVNFMRNSFSLRTVRDDVDLGLLAKSVTAKAGGQNKAAGMPIDTDTIWILEEINAAIKRNATISNEMEDSKMLILKNK